MKYAEAKGMDWDLLKKYLNESIDISHSVPGQDMHKVQEQ